MSITLLDVVLVLVLVEITRLYLINVIASLLVMRTLWMVTLLCYVAIKDAVDCTTNNDSIQIGKEMHLFIVHNKISSLL